MNNLESKRSSTFDKPLIFGSLITLILVVFFLYKEINTNTKVEPVVKQPVPRIAEQIEPVLTEQELSNFILNSETFLLDISGFSSKHQYQLLEVIERRLRDLLMDIQYINSFESTTYTWVKERGLGVLKLPKSLDSPSRWNYLNELLISMTSEKRANVVFQEPSMNNIPFTIHGIFLKAQEHSVDPRNLSTEEYGDLIGYCYDFLRTKKIKVSLEHTDEPKIYKQGTLTMVEIPQNYSMGEVWFSLNQLLIAVNNDKM